MSANCYKCQRNLCELVLDCNGDGSLTIPYPVTIEAEYKLVLKFKNKRIIFTQDLEPLNPFTFEVEGLNENYCYSFHIEDPNGEIVEFDGYNYFSICTNQEY